MTHENAGTPTGGLSAVAVPSMVLCAVILGSTFLGCVLPPLGGFAGGGHQGSHRYDIGGCLARHWFPLAYGAVLGVAGFAVSRLWDWARFAYILLAVSIVFRFLASVQANADYYGRHLAVRYLDVDPLQLWLSMALWLAIPALHLWLIRYIVRAGKQAR